MESLNGLDRCIVLMSDPFIEFSDESGPKLDVDMCYLLIVCDDVLSIHAVSNI